jgi:hypothetical protein
MHVQPLFCHCQKAAGRNIYINIYKYNITPNRLWQQQHTHQHTHPPKGWCVIAWHAHLFASRNNNHTTQFLETYCLGRTHNTIQTTHLYFAARLASAVAYSLSRGTAAPWFNSKARFLYHASLHMGSLFSLAWPLSTVVHSKPIRPMLSLYSPAVCCHDIIWCGIGCPTHCCGHTPFISHWQWAVSVSLSLCLFTLVYPHEYGYKI